MQVLVFNFAAPVAAIRPARVGVVASGDLEILVAPPDAPGQASSATVRIRTSVDGFDTVWRNVLDRFFARNGLAGRWELNDAGATPGVVALRLTQASEAARGDDADGATT